ncbi:hypothetical protein ACRAWF_24425 [Streptomyces sp. L7]
MEDPPSSGRRSAQARLRAEELATSIFIGGLAGPGGPPGWLP